MEDERQRTVSGGTDGGASDGNGPSIQASASPIVHSHNTHDHGHHEDNHAHHKPINHGWTSRGLIHTVSLEEDQAILAEISRIQEKAARGEDWSLWDNGHHDGHHHAGHKPVQVSELFFDLVFVTAVAAINDDLREDELNFENYFQYFAIIWYFWKESALYGSLFASDDLWHKIFYAFYGMGIVSLAMHCAGGWKNRVQTKRFAMTASYMCILQVVALTRAYIHIWDQVARTESELQREHKAHKYLTNRIIYFTVVAIMYFCASFANTMESHRWVLWGCVMMMILSEFFMGLWFSHDDHLYCVVSHFNERMEAFTLIVLGETVNGITVPPTKFDEGEESEWSNSAERKFYTTVVLGFLCVFLIKLKHFDVEDFHDPAIHALGQTFWRRFIWIYSIGCEGCGMALVGAGIGEFIAKAGEDLEIDETDREHWMLVIGFAIFLTFGVIARLMHREETEQFAYAYELWWTQILFQLFVAGFFLLLPLMLGDNLEIWFPVMLACIAMCFLNVLDLMDEVLEARYEKAHAGYVDLDKHQQHQHHG